MTEDSKLLNVPQSVRIDGLLQGQFSSGDILRQQKHWENLGDEDAAERVLSELANLTGELWVGQQVIIGGLRALK